MIRYFLARPAAKAFEFPPSSRRQSAILQEPDGLPPSVPVMIFIDSVQCLNLS